MFAVVVVARLDEIKDLDLGICLNGEDAALEHFVLKGAHEGLGPCVVVGIGAG